MKSRALVITFVLAVQVGCIGPKLTRRYKTMTPKTGANNSATLTVFALEVPPESSQSNVFNLSERGQAALITSLKDKTDSPKALLGAVGSPIAKPPQTPSVINLTKFKRRVVFSVENNAIQTPADRLMQATIILRLPPDKSNFVSWDRFASKYEIVDLGKLTFTQTNELNFDIKTVPPGISSIITNADASNKATRSLVEEVTLKQRYVSFTGSLTPSAARIVQQGVVGIDLTGNVAIDLDIAVKENPARPVVLTPSNLFDDKDNPTSPDAVKFLTQELIVPADQANPIEAQATLDYIMRHVVKGDSTIIEGDDEVTLASGATSSITVSLIPTSALEFSIYWLIDPVTKNVMHISKRPGGCSIGNVEPMKFLTYEDAAAFLSWLIRQSDPSPKDVYRVGSRSLCFVTQPLKRSDIGKLQVELTDDALAGRKHVSGGQQ
jgi:hypothetical protein